MTTFINMSLLKTAVIFYIAVFVLTHLPEGPEPRTGKTGFGQVSIMKEFV